MHALKWPIDSAQVVRERTEKDAAIAQYEATEALRAQACAACVAAGIHPPTADAAAAEEGVPAQSHDAGQLSEVS